MTQAWSFGGVLLDTFGVITKLDDSLDLPERRGENHMVPMHHGTIFVEKYFDERAVAFGVTIKGLTIADVQERYDALRKLIGVRTQQTLMYYLDDGTIRTAQASVKRALSVSHESPLVTRLVLEFSLANPFFRLSTAIADNETTIDASPKAMTVNNPGTVEERDATIILTGPLQNTVITNSTNGCTLTYTGTIASPRVVTISTDAYGQYVATDDLGANKIGVITHSGDAALMRFDPGDNVLSITDATATTGKVKVTFNAPFL